MDIDEMYCIIRQNTRGVGILKFDCADWGLCSCAGRKSCSIQEGKGLLSLESLQ